MNQKPTIGHVGWSPDYKSATPKLTHAMTDIHRDFTANSASHGVGVQRLVRWFVRGTKPDGTIWESGHKHATREAAEAEIDLWGPEMGTMKIVCEVSLPNVQVDAPAQDQQS